MSRLRKIWPSLIFVAKAPILERPGKVGVAQNLLHHRYCHPLIDSPFVLAEAGASKDKKHSRCAPESRHNIQTSVLADSGQCAVHPMQAANQAYTKSGASGTCCLFPLDGAGRLRGDVVYH